MADEEYFQNERGTEWKNDNRMSEEHWDNQSQSPEVQGSYWQNERAQPTYSEVWQRQPSDTYASNSSGQAVDYSSVAVDVPQHYWRDRNRKPVDLGTIYSLNVGFGQTLYKMPREAWGAMKPLSRYALSSPASKVRFTHTGTERCTTNEECMRACRDIQKYYMDLGFPDIPWNFMVGGDGVLYHGRGWVKQADRPHGFNALRRTCIDVAYIGNFENSSVPYEMLSVSTDFLKYGLKVLKITPFYQVYSFIGERHPDKESEDLTPIN